MTFDEFKSKYDEAPFTEEQQELIDRFNKSYMDLRDKVLLDSDDKRLDEFGEYLDAISYLTEDPDSFGVDESKAEWEKNWLKVQGFQSFLQKDDNFRHIMSAITGDNSFFGLYCEVLFGMMDLMMNSFGINIDANGWRKQYEADAPSLDEPETDEPSFDGPATDEPEIGEPEKSEPEMKEPEKKEPEKKEPEAKEPEKVNPKMTKKEADIIRYRGDKIKAIEEDFKLHQGQNMESIPKDVLTNAGLTDSRPHSNNVIFDLFVMAKHNVDFKDLPKFERGELEGHDKSQYLKEFQTFLEEHPISKLNDKGEREYIPENAKAWGAFYSDVDKKLSEYRLPEVDLGNPDTYGKAADEIALMDKIGTDVVQVIQDHQMEKFRNPELNAAFVEGFGSIKNEMHFWANCVTLQNIKSMTGQLGVLMTGNQTSNELSSVVAARWFATQNQDLYQGKTLQEYRKNIPFIPSTLMITANRPKSSYSKEEMQAIDAFLENGTPLPKNLAESFEQAVNMAKNDINPTMVAEEVSGELNALTRGATLDNYVKNFVPDGDASKMPDIKSMTPEQRKIAENTYDHIMFSAYNMYSASCNMTDMDKEPFDLIMVNGTGLSNHCKKKYEEQEIFGEGKKWDELKPEERESFMKMETARALLDPVTKLECHTLVPDKNGTLSVSAKGTVAGKFDAAANKKFLEEEERRAERKTHRKRWEGVINDADELYKPFIDIYGPDGKMPRKIGYDKPEEYDNIKLEVPEGLDELTVTAIVIGAAMDPKYMSRASSSSTAIVGSMVENNQMHLVNNVVMGDSREKNFCPLMTEARLEAKEALEAYKAGDATKVTKMLQTYVDYCAAVGNSASAGGATTSGIDVEKQAYMLGQHIVDRGILGVKPNPKGYTELNSMRLQSYAKQMDAFVRSERSRIDLIDRFDQMDKNTRDGMIADMMFDSYIAVMANKQEKARISEKDVYVDELFASFGMDTTSDDYLSEFPSNKHVLNTGNKMLQYIHTYSITDFDAILSKPDGLDQLKSLYMEEIKKTDAYKKMTAAASGNELADRMIEAAGTMGEGITSFKNVKLPEAAKPYNEKYKDKKQRAVNDIKRQIVEVALKQPELWGDEVEEYGLKSLNPEDVKKNADQISAMYDEMAELDDRRSPESFKKLLDQLKNIKDITQKNASKGSVLNHKEAVAYERAVDSFERLAAEYFDGAAKNASEAERAESVAGIRRRINAGKVPVDSAMEKMDKEVEKEIFGEQRKLFNGLDPRRPPHMDVFYGEKYRDQKTRQASQYTLYRSAGISVAVFALFNTGKYSFEDIMDPEKLQEEKRQMFDEVAQRMLHNTPENQEWIAKTIYEGQKNTEHAMNEQAKEVDFATVDIATDKRFCQMLHLSALQFDAWQEISNCKQEIYALAKTEHPEMNDFEDYKKWWADRRGPLALVSDSLDKMQSHAIDLATSPDDFEGPLRGVISEYVATKNYMQAMNEAMLMKDVPFAECLDFDKVLDIRSKGVLIGEEIKKYARKFEGKHLAAMDVLDSIVNDTYMYGKEIKVDPEAGKVELKGFPDEEQIKRQDQRLRADSVNAVERFDKLGRDARAATAGVFFGSKQFDNAMSAIDKVHVAFKELQEIEKLRIKAANTSDVSSEELQELEEQKEAKQAEVKALMTDAKYDIERYFDRKRKRGEMGPNADEKSKRRIAVMEDAMSAMEEYTLQLEAEDVVAQNEKLFSSGETVEPELNFADEDLIEGRKTEYQKQLGADGIDGIGKNGALKAISALEEIAKGEGDLTPKEKRIMRLAMAAMVFDEMLNGPEGDVIREKMSQDIKTYKEQVTKIADSPEFKASMPKNPGREDVKDFIILDSKTKEMLDTFREKTAETAAKQKNGPEKRRQSVGPQQKPEQEIAGRKRSNTVSAKPTQPSI